MNVNFFCSGVFVGIVVVCWKSDDDDDDDVVARFPVRLEKVSVGEDAGEAFVRDLLLSFLDFDLFEEEL